MKREERPGGYSKRNFGVVEASFRGEGFTAGRNIDRSQNEESLLAERRAVKNESLGDSMLRGEARVLRGRIAGECLNELQCFEVLRLTMRLVWILGLLI